MKISVNPKSYTSNMNIDRKEVKRYFNEHCSDNTISTRRTYVYQTYNILIGNPLSTTMVTPKVDAALKYFRALYTNEVVDEVVDEPDNDIVMDDVVMDDVVSKSVITDVGKDIHMQRIKRIAKPTYQPIHIERIKRIPRSIVI
jgi:hypothetical protein